MGWLKQLFQGNRVNEDGANEVKSKAYLAYNEWGPDGVKHRNNKLADVMPEVPEQTRTAWVEEFKKLDAEVWDCVGKSKFKESERNKFFDHMRARYPFMNQQALDKAWFLYGYYIIHG